MLQDADNRPSASIYILPFHRLSFCLAILFVIPEGNLLLLLCALARQILKLQIGDKIKLTEPDFTHLCKAYFAEIESKFV